MRNEWYGDKRDFLKWPALLYLARRQKIGRIFQVAMCTDAVPTHPKIKTLNGQMVECQDISRHVADHYHRHNDLNGIRAVGKHFGIDIEVWLEQFTHATRVEYFQEVLKEIRKSTARTVWFFDPDTGIEPPKSEADKTHMRLQELSNTFALLRPRDYLACYQHAWWKQDWRTQARTRLSEHMSVDENEVEVFTSDYSKDVIILAVERKERWVSRRPTP